MKGIIYALIFIAAIVFIPIGSSCIAGIIVGLTPPGVEVELAPGAGCNGSRAAITIVNRTSVRLWDLEIDTGSDDREVRYINLESMDGVPIMNEDGVSVVNMVNGRRTLESVPDDGGEHGTDNLHVNPGDADRSSKRVHAEFDFGPRPGDKFQLVIELENGDCNKTRSITVKPTNASGAFLDGVVGSSEGPKKNFKADTIDQRMNDIFVGEQEAFIFGPDDIILWPFSSGWLFSGQPSASVIEGDVSIGTPYIEDGRVVLPILEGSSQESIIEFSSLYMDATSFPSATVLASVDVSNLGDSSGVLIVGFGETTEIPTLTEWGIIIFCVLLFGWMAWAVVRRRRKASIST